MSSKNCKFSQWVMKFQQNEGQHFQLGIWKQFSKLSIKIFFLDWGFRKALIPFSVSLPFLTLRQSAKCTYKCNFSIHFIKHQSSLTLKDYSTHLNALEKLVPLQLLLYANKVSNKTVISMLMLIWYLLLFNWQNFW